MFKNILLCISIIFNFYLLQDYNTTIQDKVDEKIEEQMELENNTMRFKETKLSKQQYEELDNLELMDFEDIKVGSGEKIVTNESKIELSIQIKSSKRNAIIKEQKNTIDLTKPSIIKKFEYLLLGMKENGVRQVEVKESIIKAAKIYYRKSDQYYIILTVHKIY